MEIAFVLGGLFLFCTVGFLAIAFFFPELVGIQGAQAKRIEEEQRGKPSDPPSNLNS